MSEYICPHCKKPVYDDDALLCLYCGESLERGVGFLGRMRYPGHLAIVLVVFILVLIIAFLFLMVW